MANKGKLESLLTIPSGGYDFSLDDATGGPYTVSLTADNTYYWSAAGNDTVDLPARLKERMDAASVGNTYTVTISAGEGGTGKLTIAVDSGTFDLTWTDTELRDLCGFDANISAAASSTGADQVHGLWLPDCPPMTPFSVSDEGWDESDAITTMAPTGQLCSTVYNTRVATSLEWRMVAKARARTADESTTNESFQTFYKQSLWGLKEWASAGGPINYHPDADVDGTFTNYGVVLDKEFKPPQVTAGFDSWYTVMLRRLVKVP